MTHATVDTERALSTARERGDPDALAEALAAHANALVQTGQLTKARDEIDEVAAIHRERGRHDDDARYMALAATVSRLSGDLDGARQRASRVLEVAPPGSDLAAAATSELVDVALAQQRPDEAASLVERVLASATTGLATAVRATLLRKRAAALASMGRFDEAATALTDALTQLQQAGEGPAARRTMVELATLLQQSNAEAAERVRERAMTDAREANDQAVIADLRLLETTAAVTRGDVEGALAAAREARDAALAGVSPVAYTSAAATISRLAEQRGDRVGAYEALAVGWATLRDLMGDALARRTFEPALLGLRSRWGEAEFDAVKGEYEARRRRELSRSGSR
jgi:tetratricopeptide (TPR) repeat protein